MPSSTSFPSGTSLGGSPPQEEEVTWAVRLKHWLTIGVALASTCGMGVQALLQAKAEGTGAVDAVIKLGFPTAIALFGILWFFTSYLPRQERKDERRVGLLLNEHRQEVERLRTVQEALLASHERREERQTRVYEDTIRVMMNGLDTFKAEVKAEMSPIRELKAEVSALREQITGRYSRIPSRGGSDG